MMVEYMKVNGKMIKEKVAELCIMQVVTSIKEIGRMTRNMVKGYNISIVVPDMKEK